MALRDAALDRWSNVGVHKGAHSAKNKNGCFLLYADCLLFYILPVSEGLRMPMLDANHDIWYGLRVILFTRHIN